MDQHSTPGLGRALLWIGFWVILPLVLGAVLAYVLVPQSQVGVIRFEGVIWSGSARQLVELLDHAQQEDRIRAVVLDIESPGGEVSASEEVYYRLLELREHKPVVVTIGSMAASGGYYIAAAADQVYAKPASLVGNVGVVSFLPSADERRFADENYVSTGPFKFSGGSRGGYMRQIELAKLGFLEAVFAQRSDRLSLDREALAGGEIFMGLQAERLGLVDALGSSSDAVAKAAEMARMRRYVTVDLNRQVLGGEALDAASSYRQWLARSRGESTLYRGLYYLYVEPQERGRTDGR
jgi:protease-4